MNKISRWIIWFIPVFSFLGVLALYPSLPEKIPMQWNYNWNVSKTGPKHMILFLSALPLLMVVLFAYLPKLDPRGENYKKHKKVYELLKYVLMIFLIFLNWITIAVAFEIRLPIKAILTLVFGLLFIIIGNYLPKFKSNYFVGIRNPWVLSDDTVWRKTHKAGGYVFIGTGVMFILSAFLQIKILYTVLYFFLLASIVGLNVYSYLLYKKSGKKQ